MGHLCSTNRPCSTVHRRYSMGRQNDPTGRHHPTGPPLFHEPPLFHGPPPLFHGPSKRSHGASPPHRSTSIPRTAPVPRSTARYSMGRQNAPTGRHHPMGHCRMPPQAATSDSKLLQTRTDKAINRIFMIASSTTLILIYVRIVETVQAKQHRKFHSGCRVLGKYSSRTLGVAREPMSGRQLRGN